MEDRMSSVAVPVSTKDFLRLARFLSEQGSARDPVAAVTDAIDYFLMNAEWKSEDLLPELRPDMRGVRWKDVFLPSGTKVRMRYNDTIHYAVIEGDDLKYLGEAMSPAEFANRVSNTSVNAWQYLWILRPSDEEWIAANTLRAETPTRVKKSTVPEVAVAVSGDVLSGLVRMQAAGFCKGYRECIMRALLEFGGRANRSDVIRRTIEIRKMLGASIPSSAEATVQSAFEASCRHSDNYKGESNAALFEWPKGKGAGVWSLNFANVDLHIRQLLEE